MGVYLLFINFCTNSKVLISNDAICHNIGTLRADRQKKFLGEEFFS